MKQLGDKTAKLAHNEQTQVISVKITPKRDIALLLFS